MKIHCLHDKLVSIDKLKAHPKNRNTHPKDQITRLAKILKYQGWRYPIKISKRSGFITSGHGRLEAARVNGWKKVPVNVQPYESDEQEYADVQSDNAIASWAELDFSGINTDLGDLGPDFDIDLLGIKNFEIDVADKEGLTDEDEVPEHVEPKTRLGDTYQLGAHRLMCGDSTSIDAVDKLMNGEKADMVFTDPPYNIAEKTTGYASSAPTNKQNEKLMSCDWDKGFKFEEIQASLFSALSDNCSVYICTSSFLAHSIWLWMEAVLDHSSYCIWSKPNPFPSLAKRHWAFSTELVCHGTRGKHVFNYPNQGNALSVWTIPIGEGGLHPTQKPVRVPEHAIAHSSIVGQTVLDLFGGSGSTLIACEKTNRKCFMMELDPHYCDVIVARWEKYTGRKSELVNGQT